jgi:hypothetical protein
VRAALVVFAVLAAFTWCTRLLGADSAEQQRDGINQQNTAAAGSGSGLSGVNASERSVFSLRQGDCLSDVPGEGEFDTMSAVSCSSPLASAEVLSLVLVSVETAGYPGLPYFEEQFNLYCDADATYFLYPTPASWDEGDRTVTCLQEY